MKNRRLVKRCVFTYTPSGQRLHSRYLKASDVGMSYNLDTDGPEGEIISDYTIDQVGSVMLEKRDEKASGTVHFPGGYATCDALGEPRLYFYRKDHLGNNRVVLDGKEVINDWRDHTYTQKGVRIQVEAGKKYPIRVEFYDGTNDATLRLSVHATKK